MAEYFHILLENRGSFEAAFGGELIWEEVESRKSCRIGVVLGDASTLKEDKHSEYLEWLIDTQTRLRSAFNSHRSLLSGISED